MFGRGFRGEFVPFAGSEEFCSRSALEEHQGAGYRASSAAKVSFRSVQQRSKFFEAKFLPQVLTYPSGVVEKLGLLVSFGNIQMFCDPRHLSFMLWCVEIKSCSYALSDAVVKP